MRQEGATTKEFLEIWAILGHRLLLLSSYSHGVKSWQQARALTTNQHFRFAQERVSLQIREE